MPTPTLDPVDPITQRLHAIAEQAPDLKEVVRIYELILPLVRNTTFPVKPLEISQDQARAKLEAGQPLLSGIELPIDEEDARPLMIQLARALGKGPIKEDHASRRFWPRNAQRDQPADESPRAAAAKKIAVLLEEGHANVSGLLAQVVAGDRAAVVAWAEKFQLDADLLWTLAQFALRSFLWVWRAQLAPWLGDLDWSKRYCFVCGADTILGELQGNEQAKHLRCLRCGADWSVLRLQCVYCRTEDHRQLGYLYAEGQREKWRVQVCDNCKGYLKILASFEPTRAELLPVEDLAMLHLDLIAQAQGYTRTPA